MKFSNILGRINKLIAFTIFHSIILVQTSCNKLVEVEAPITALTSENVYSNDAAAISVITGIYVKMSNGSYQFATGQNSLSVLEGLAADELSLANSSGNFLRYYTNKLNSVEDEQPWQTFYNCVLTVNTAIEKLENSNEITLKVKQQLTGEAKFIRALCYFYLVNLYGDVPLILSSDYRINAKVSRVDKSTIYAQIIDDLKSAQNLLSETYIDGTLLNASAERIRPTKWAATALLARTYLYANDWANAEAQASMVIGNSLFSLSSIDNTFLKASAGNKEAIWQLQPVITGWNTEDAKIFVLNAAPGNTSGKPVFLDTLFLKAFEKNDARRINWIKDTTFSGVKYSYANKYKIATSGSPVNEYLMVLRLGEQYLIQAEAKAQQNKLTEALSDLDKIRFRANLPLLSTTNPGITKTALLDLVLHEKRLELFTEWGHRWFDLKRTGKIDDVMKVATPFKGSTWEMNWSLNPLPSYDITQNPLLKQNPGY